MQFPEGGDQTSRLSVLVVGVGPGGLLTALECCRRSFKVQILEKSPSFSMQGSFQLHYLLKLIDINSFMAVPLVANYLQVMASPLVLLR